MKSPGHSLLLPLAFGGLLLLAPPESRATPASPPPTVVSESAGGTLVAMIASIDPEKLEIGLLTGCGHSLRALRVSLIPETKLTRMGASILLSDLRRGATVRVEFHREGPGRRATAVEVVSAGEAP